MPHKLLSLALLCALLAGCRNPETETLQKEVDSLKQQLEKSYETSRTLTEIGTLLDSIDATRKVLRVNLVEAGRVSQVGQENADLDHVLQTASRGFQRQAYVFQRD